MKTLLRTLTLAALATTALALPAFAQTAAAPAAAAPAQANICEEAARGELYTKYYEAKKVDQKVAYETGQQYLQKYTSCNDVYSKAVQKFVDAYGAALSGNNDIIELDKAIKEKRVADSFTVGKKVLAAKPDDVKITVALAWVGYNGVIPGGTAANNAALTTDTLNFAQKAIQLLESGKTSDGYGPFTTKDDALGWMNYVVGALNLKTSPTDSIARFTKIAQMENSSAKKEATTYSYLAFAYEKTDYAKYNDQYKQFIGKDESDQSRLTLANLNLVIDNIIDAYARAVAYAGNSPRKAEWQKTLTDLYKSRHTTEAGLPELLAQVMTTPLPAFTPLTTPPPPATPATPATGTTTSSATPPAGTASLGTTLNTAAPEATPAAAPKVATPAAKATATTTTTTRTTTTTARPATAAKPAAPKATLTRTRKP